MNELHGEMCEQIKRIGFSGPGKPTASGSPVCKTLVICSKSRTMILKGLKYPESCRDVTTEIIAIGSAKT